MKLSLVSLISILMILTGCEQQQFEYEFGSAEKAATNSSSDAEGNDREEVKSEEEDLVEEEEVKSEEEAPAEEVAVAFTQADLLAMDNVTITVMVTADGEKYYSDIGRTAATNQALVTGAGYQLGTEVTQAAVFQVKVGQTMIFCNHPNSIDTLRVHGGGGAPFAHWPNGTSLAAGECADGSNSVVANAGVTPGNNFYNHDENNGRSEIFVDVQP